MYTSLDQAVRTKFEIINRIVDIDLQLTKRAAQSSWRATPEIYQEYMEWKGRVCHAKARLGRRLNKVKQWIAQETSRQALERAERLGRGGMLAELFSTIKSLAADGAVLSEEQQVLLDAVEAFLNMEKGLPNEEAAEV